jgi:hypothetical protein
VRGPCRWSGGCAQDATEGELCFYHSKVAGGLITHTRGQSRGNELVHVRMSAEDRKRAEKAADRYLRGLVDKEPDER